MNMKISGLLAVLFVSTGIVHAMSPWQQLTCVSAVSALTGAAGYGLSKEEDKRDGAGQAGTLGVLLGCWGCRKLSHAMHVEQGWNDMREAESVFGEVRRLCLPADVFSYSNKVAGVADNSWSLRQAMKTLTLCRARSIAAKKLADEAGRKNPNLTASVDAFKRDVSQGQAEIDNRIEVMSRRKDMSKPLDTAAEHDQYSKFLWLQTHREWRAKVAAELKRSVKN